MEGGKRYMGEVGKKTREWRDGTGGEEKGYTALMWGDRASQGSICF